MGRFSLIIGVLLVLIAIIIFIANVRNRYLDIFSVLADSKLPCVSGWNLAFSVEHPWIANIFISKPINSTVGQFLVDVIRAKQLYYIDVCEGYGDVPGLNRAVGLATSVAQQDQADTWAKNTGRMGELIPWEAPIVQDYVKSIQTARDLQTLWVGGFYAYAIDKYSGTESVDTMWNYLFTTPRPPPDSSDQCGDVGMTAFNGALGGAGMGVMTGAALGGTTGGPVGAGIGFLIGGLAGAFASIAAKKQTSCL